MIQLHLNAEDHALVTKAEFKPHMQISHADGAALSDYPWSWYVKRQTIFGRDIWLFIEEDSHFCLCFFDLKARDLKQLDLTLWLRFISEQSFMTDKNYYGAQLPVDERFLTAIRSLMAPMSLHIADSEQVNALAAQIFGHIEIFFKQPLPQPLPLRYEMELNWNMNTSQHPVLEEGQDKTLNTDQIKDLLRLNSESEVVDFPLGDIDPEAVGVDDIHLMEIIHDQLKTGTQNSMSPALVFTSKISNLVESYPSDWGRVVNFRPRSDS